MARDPSKIKTPGVTTEQTDSETNIDSLADASPGLDDGAVPENVTMTVSQLQALISAEVSKVISAQRPAEINAAPAALPDQSEIDVKTITRPTLSKQGYVVPEGYGEPANASIKRD